VKRKIEMELVAFDYETVTIKMKWKGEFAGLRAILEVAAVDYGLLDHELLNMTDAEVNALEDALRAVEDATN
jgi:hypothetical protein